MASLVAMITHSIKRWALASSMFPTTATTINITHTAALILSVFLDNAATSTNSLHDESP